MASITVTEARKRLCSLSDKVRAIQETLYLTSIPGMRDSIREVMATTAEAMRDQPDWYVTCEGPTPGASTSNIASSTALKPINS